MSQQKKHERSQARDIFWSKHERVAYACPDCGRRESSLRSGIEVHHKDGDTSNNQIDNLIGVCRVCHSIREAKKPSLNEIKLLRDQVNGRRSADDKIASVTSQSDASQHYEQCEMLDRPMFQVKQIHRRKYAQIEVDFVTARGWRSFFAVNGDTVEAERDDLRAILTKPATVAVSQIMKSYTDSQMPSHNSTTTARYGSSIIDFPPLLPDVAWELAEKLSPIILNSDNWEPLAQKRDTETEYVPVSARITSHVSTS